MTKQNSQFEIRNSKFAKVLLLAVVLFLGLVQASFNKPSLAQVPQPAQVPQSVLVEQIPERQYGRVRINAERGVRVTLGNRTTGRITVNGWDRDVIEAHAVSERGDEVVIAIRPEDPTIKSLFLKADYADLDQPSAPTSRLPNPPLLEGRSFKVHLEVNLPRYTEIELIRVWRSDVQVTGVETPVNVFGEQSSVMLKRVGPVKVRTRSGNVEVEDANGGVEVLTTSGAARVHKTKGDVRVVSINGPIEIKCVRGRVEVANTVAPIELVNIDGQVDAVATYSSVRFTGRLRDDGKYDLKSMSGRVEMILPSDTHGFDAALTSYQGLVETDFKLTVKQVSADGTGNRRLTGHFGNGKARIILDSFEGLVRLTKAAPGSIEGCK
ncbi:MAG: DUF4097 family beta strand repeat-containing protein [Pyrinomonadaceae bacterium]